MKKFFICMVLALTLLISGMSAYAVTPEEELFDEESISSRLQTITSDLSEASLLEEEQVSALTEYQIGEYIETEPFAEGKNVSPGEIC